MSCQHCLVIFHIIISWFTLPAACHGSLPIIVCCHCCHCLINTHPGYAFAGSCLPPSSQSHTHGWLTHCQYILFLKPFSPRLLTPHTHCCPLFLLYYQPCFFLVVIVIISLLSRCLSCLHCHYMLIWPFPFFPAAHIGYTRCLPAGWLKARPGRHVTTTVTVTITHHGGSLE